MFKIESYVTPILLSYVDKYVRDFKPADAQVSLWGGGVALHNLVLKADVLQQEVSLPFTLVSGRIHELLIHVPWTKIMSEPIVVTIDTIECVLSLTPPNSSDATQPTESNSPKSQVVEAPPGYMQALVRRIVSNIALRVHHLIVKYVQDDIVMSLNVKHVAVDSAGVSWEPAFADIDPALPVVRRLVRLDDLTLCLDRADSDGKIRHYQEPLLYRCQLNFRVSTKLVSANTRRASSLSVQLRSSKLAFSVTNDQLVLLIRLLRERRLLLAKQTPPPMKTPNAPRETPLHAGSVASMSPRAEPVRQGSWSEWAWSWLPAWQDREGDMSEAPVSAEPLPVYFAACFDDISLAYKMMEMEASGRKRARTILELCATHAAIKSNICSPTTLRVFFGTRLLTLCSHGRCVCGSIDPNTSQNLPTIYLKRVGAEEKEWSWPEGDLNEKIVVNKPDEQKLLSKSTLQSTGDEQQSQVRTEINAGQPEEPTVEEADEEEVDGFWQQMAPVLFLEYNHERSPPDRLVNPYDNPPIDFEYSDWVEICNVKVKLDPVELRVCTGFIHRMQVLENALLDLPPFMDEELPMHTLTVEENEALQDNLPQRKIVFEVQGLNIQLNPVEHSMHIHHERVTQPLMLLDIDVPSAIIVINGPLYPHRVCSAACQLPEDKGPLHQGARLNISVAVTGLQVRVMSTRDLQPRPCARTDLRLVAHVLLNKKYFDSRQTVQFSYSAKIREANISGSAGRLLAACHVPLSMLRGQMTAALKYSSLPNDCLHDEEAVTVDMTIEEVSARGYLTRNMNTHIISVQSARATVFHAPEGEETKQAWIFSAPDAPSTTPYLRLAVQWCTGKVENSLDYIGIWTEPVAFSIDPLFVTFLAYKPHIKHEHLGSSSSGLLAAKSSNFFQRRRVTPPSSSGRSSRGAELVHVRPRSLESGSEPSEKKEPKQEPKPNKPSLFEGERLVALHERLRRMLVNVELGLVLVYVTSSTVSALDCATMRDAMERHAATSNVLAVGLGRLSMHSNSSMKHLWQEIRHDGPTFFEKPENAAPTPAAEESFPWKLRLADMSCYTLETAQLISEKEGLDKSASGLRSQIKLTSAGVHPRTVLELTTTTVTLSVMAKSLQIKVPIMPDKKKAQTEKPGAEKEKYFQTGLDFQPTTLKEFLRGPVKRKKEEPDKKSAPEQIQTQTMVGPVVALGVHMHADTPPVIVRIAHDQVHIMASAIHCLQHILTLLRRPAIVAPRQHSRRNIRWPHTTSVPGSVSEQDELRDSRSDSTISENPSELIPIYEAKSVSETGKLKKSFWFQWVVGRATLVVATPQVKFAFDIDDVISTVDLQEHYNQFKMKLASASVKHYERTTEDWVPGVLGGRVLEAREPTELKEDNHFLSVTITQAQISNLPESWKAELHPKMLERRMSLDTMWEVYATLAPLEAVLQPVMMEHAVLLLQQIAPRSFCELQTEPEARSTVPFQWPFMFITAGGIRLLITGEEEIADTHDTFIFSVGKVMVTPHPDNPICRRPTNCTDPSWTSTNVATEGRQYEVMVRNVAVRSAQFKQIITDESPEAMKGQENPAVKWSRPRKQPGITPVLHPVDIGVVLAPALYTGGVLAYGPAVEVNLLTDCAVELSVGQLSLAKLIAQDMHRALTDTHSPILAMREERLGVCPYTNLLKSHEYSVDSPPLLSNASLVDGAETVKTMDSGFDTGASQSTYKLLRQGDETTQSKKAFSVVFAENHWADASEYLEVFVTMGIIELSLYVADDNSDAVAELRSPIDKEAGPTVGRPTVPTNVQEQTKVEAKPQNKSIRSDQQSKMSGSGQSITTEARQVDVALTTINLSEIMKARKIEGNIPLVHGTLYQPNLYYWKKKNQRSLQVSLFNAWVGLGAGEVEDLWHLPLLTTARGVRDPATDIPPALATMKIVAPSGASMGSGSPRGTIKLDIERPVQLQISFDRLRRLMAILALLKERVATESTIHLVMTPEENILYRFRRFMGKQGMESVTVQTSQISVSGSAGTFGWDSSSAQLACGSRPDRVLGRVLVCGALASAGPPGDRRHLLLQPLIVGAELQATWEAWRRVELGIEAHTPSVQSSLTLDAVTADLRPCDLDTLTDMLKQLKVLLNDKAMSNRKTSTEYRWRDDSFLNRSSSAIYSHSDTDLADHYYKDDLRSGAFKMVSGGQLPMAYQVMVHGYAVSWRYPHPRAVTRIVAFPIPGLDEEVDCVLELYSVVQAKWMAHTYFKLPVNEPREINLFATPPETVFALTWRFRACSEDNKMEEGRPFEFNMFSYMPRDDPLLHDISPERHTVPIPSSGVTAEQLSGVLRVDSYFAPRMLPRVRFALQVVNFELNLHNSLPDLTSRASQLEGYYVSRPLMRSHRVLSLLARDVSANSHMGSQAGSLVVFEGKMSADILESATGAIEEMVQEFKLRGAISLPNAPDVKPRARCRTSRVRVALHLPRVRTLQALARDWRRVVDKDVSSQTTEEEITEEVLMAKSEIAKATATVLEGRVALWVHNSCGSALRVGQEGTDEVVPLAPGARLAYRWRSPTAKKRIRFAVASPNSDWHWSNSVPFVAGTFRVRLEDGESLGDGKMIPGAGVYMHVKVEETGATRTMHLVGRLTLANMLRQNLLYKVRARCSMANQWRTVCSGELLAETVGRTVICGADCDMVLKIKFTEHDTGWSGDIPLKECPKENVPWLVKVPNEGEVPYSSVWCRVVRARSDGRVLATVWPLYVLHSALPLDTVVMITTNPISVSNAELPESMPPTLVQTAPGRGTSTHISAPGTTSARHSLTFQYKNIDCPVTREAVPMHYGVTDSSVFDKRPPIADIDDIIADVQQWLRTSARNAISDWPYSLVTKHWPSAWQPALLQPRCDVTVRYEAVRAGGGCSLKILLWPVVLLCNAAPLALTLRAHDAAPLCKLEPGTAISLPAIVLKKPFFMSVEVGRETFVSGQLKLASAEPGRYGAPPPGQLAEDHAAEFTILCNHKVALLTMYYEIKEDINILGVTSTYVILNRLNIDILVSAITVPTEMESTVVLRASTYKVVPPTKLDSIHGTPLGRFWLRGRWHGTSPTELRNYVCLALPNPTEGSAVVTPAHLPVPIRLNRTVSRRAVGLIDWKNKSIPVVVTQMKHEGRYLIAVGPDPCPQFVVHNRTGTALCVAQPQVCGDEPSTSLVTTEPECPGTQWRCLMLPSAILHYSTPAHCARHPPPAAPPPPSLPLLTFAKAKASVEMEPTWCPPVVVADGEQLLQLQSGTTSGITVKLRVKTNPHSTLLELQDVDHTDISASDIRKRLDRSLLQDSESFMSSHELSQLERIGGDETLLKLKNRNKTSQEIGLGLDTHELKVPPAPEPATKMSVTEIKPMATVSGDLGIIKDASKQEVENPDIFDEPPEDLEPPEKEKPVATRLSFTEEPADTDVIAHDMSKASVNVRCPVSVWEEGESRPATERLRLVLDGVVVEVAAAADTRPLLALHAGRVAAHVSTVRQKTSTVISVSDVQLDNLQYETGQFDFGVVASTRNECPSEGRWPPIWNLFANTEAFRTHRDVARVLLMMQHDTWTVADFTYNELTEVDMSLGPLSLYIEDAYVSALAALWRLSAPLAQPNDAAAAIAEENVLQRPLRLRVLHIQPLDLTLTLHTAVRMYIALDQSPLRLSTFRVQDMMTSAEQLTHALTVHYLSAAILGAGWMVGGLELLGAPGAIAARLGEASGGVRGIVSATAAALLRSLSAWAGSLARNLDLLAGDEEYARRAAAARRHPPASFMAGLAAGITNFAINILGAVGGLAHHPLVGVAVGESESGATALRRGLVGALTKPLSATADLVAYAGHGLLSQTGWDPIPQPRILDVEMDARAQANWQRDCVRWCFRLCEMAAVCGFEVLLDNAPLTLLFTHKLLVVADPDSERIVEMIDFKFCSIGPFQGAVIELKVSHRRNTRSSEPRTADEDDEYQISAAAMARVARYTGAERAGAGGTGEARVLAFMCVPARAPSLHAALVTAIHHNQDSHFSLL